MKTVYVPAGETVSYESLETERLVVMGCLKVTYGIKAKTISGSGVICAGSVEADDIRIDDVEASSVICKHFLAKRAKTPELFASESAAVSCFLSAAYVETGKLTVAISEVNEVKAEEIVHLSARERSLFGLLLASALRSFWTALTASPVRETVSEEATEPEEENKEAANAEIVQEVPEPVDEELNRFVGMFKLLREGGYTLRVVPGTPEENAPTFDFESGHIVRQAA